ncbi:unnamed protein product [Linum tenue]|uniref:non-specific serine/threonine protein kinase n=1 Tax=Linum tenue TaxID=586396 RepID=A0AAV0RFP7_9ROSI|nr:unnamed protein product [Linum tenue]
MPDLPLLIFLTANVLFLISTAAADDSAAMLKLAAALSPTPTGWSTTSSSSYCNWEGIKCDSSNRVISINLAKQGISGTLPDELSTLTQLQTLSLQQNLLSGSIPSLPNLSFLQQLYLSSNNFTSIPPTFFHGLTSLQIFSISDNLDLSPWPIPLDLNQSSSLTTFEASNAQISGPIPDIFSSLPSLQNLRLSYNNLTSSLPNSFSSSGIQNLWLNNQLMGLSGPIDVLSSMASLKQVWLHKNQFTGPIPDLSKCENLFDLQLRDNQFTGVIPPGILSLPALLNISLSNNKLQGPKPKFADGVKVDDNDINNYCLPTPGIDCDPQVNTLLQVAAGFGYPVSLSDSWTGNDACGDWAFVICDSQKKVSTVNLGKQRLGGIISPAFSNLTALKNLYLNDDNLSGSIPDSLSKLTQLRILDVSNNNLSGIVPPALTSSSALKFITQPGNALLGTDVPGPDGSSSPSGANSTNTDRSSGGGGKSKASPGMIAGVLIAVIVFVALVLFVLFKCIVMKKKKIRVKSEGLNKDSETGVLAANKSNGAASCCTNGYGTLSEMQSQSSGTHSDRHLFEGGNVVISIEVLRQVTDNFSEANILGQGGFGVVYKGELHDGTKIAVKRMESSAMGTKGLNEFQAEIGVLTKVRHRHLVALLGYCINGHERLLVYEYIPQGTLAQHLFEWRERGSPPLNWKQRITIALDVARGVEYLHSLAQQSFIHRDLKPSNILLGDDMRAKVADFGLVKNAPDGKYSLETRLAGTFGYLAPEYAATGRVTRKVDVYAFGVILMEIVTGRKALDDDLPDERSHLVTWFRRLMINKESIPKAIDEALNPDDEETLGSILKVAELAGHCTAREPQQRPDMGHAVNILGPLVEQWKPSSQEEEEENCGGIDMHMSLPQFLQRWQADEGTSTMYSRSDIGSSLVHDGQSHSSIPGGFPDTFTSTDCR